MHEQVATYALLANLNSHFVVCQTFRKDRDCNSRISLIVVESEMVNVCGHLLALSDGASSAGALIWLSLPWGRVGLASASASAGAGAAHACCELIREVGIGLHSSHPDGFCVCSRCLI